MAFTVFSRGTMAAATGSLTLFSAFENDGPMWIGEGPREERRRVDFGVTFIEPPMVHVGLGMWDISNRSNLRVQVMAEEIEDSGFTISLRTWSDTRIARASVSWMAVGMVHDPDLWDV